MTLENLLRTQVESKDFEGTDIKVSPDFRVSVQQIFPSSYGVYIIVHPLNHNGKTLDLVVDGNKVKKRLQAKYSNEIWEVTKVNKKADKYYLSQFHPSSTTSCVKRLSEIELMGEGEV